MLEEKGEKGMKKTKLEAKPEIPNLNGCRVIARCAEAIYIRLPRELHRSLAAKGFSPCKCGHCDGSGLMDTLCVPINPAKYDGTSTVHMPDSSVAGFNESIKKLGREFKAR